MINEPKYPSMWKMIANFAMALVQHIKEGSPITSPVDYAKRLKTCNACPHLNRESFRCGKCGCLLEHKAKWATSTCPDDPPRWGPTQVPKLPENEG